MFGGKCESLVSLEELASGLLYSSYSKFLRDLEGALNEVWHEFWVCFGDSYESQVSLDKLMFGLQVHCFPAKP